MYKNPIPNNNILYNRDNLYGSDMFSLANMIENYNIKESDTRYYGKIERADGM